MLKNERYVIDVDGEAAGILIGEDARFTFHASADWAWPLDGRTFAEPTEAENALTAQRRASDAAAA